MRVGRTRRVERPRLPATLRSGSDKDVPVLCVWVPSFPLLLERMRRRELAEVPLALHATSGSHEISAACSLAESAGVRPGMRVSQAVGLCSHLVLLEPDPAWYEEIDRQLLETLRSWGPLVEPVVPGTFFVSAGGLDRLYGPPAEQVRHLYRMLSMRFPRRADEVGLLDALRMGYAPGTFAARVAARTAGPGRPIRVPRDRLEEFLADQPVSMLPVSARMITRLERLGVLRLGQLTALPEQALVTQFGADGRRAYAWATGQRIDAVRPVFPPPPVCAALDFPTPIGDIQMLHAAIDRLLDRALRTPARKGRSVRMIRLTGGLEGGGSWALRVALREPVGERARLTFVLRSKVALDPPSRAVEHLSLAFTRFGPAATQADLFVGVDDPSRFGGIDTSTGGLLPPIRDAARSVEVRLGEGALFRIIGLQPDSRIPERRHALLPLEVC